jgi:hypothetical protein
VFVVIDFETADFGPDSACAVGIVRLEGLKIVHRESIRIRPPRPRALFTDVHGITWEMVKYSPGFAETWPRLAQLLEGASAGCPQRAVRPESVSGLLRGCWAQNPGCTFPLHTPASPPEMGPEAE